MTDNRCGWSGQLEWRCDPCTRRACHACGKKVTRREGYVCNKCYSKMDIQELSDD